jgi:hypothetical protein
MNMFIKVLNGVPHGNPILEDNFRQAFPDIDVNNLPEGWARFERIEPPMIGVYEVYEGASYQQDGDVFKDSHQIRQMTNEEKIQTQNHVKQAWSDAGGFSSWIFDEETCSFNAPVAQPADGRSYIWDEENLRWNLNG